jgi:predicted transcriptional regulator
LSEIRDKIMDIIHSDWPIHATEIAEKMGYDVSTKEAQRVSVAKIKYHVDQLARGGDIKVKKVGQALVCWPNEVEKLRMMYELMRGL